MTTIIMAGGRGTCISELFSNVPKPKIPIDSTPSWGGRFVPCLPFPSRKIKENVNDGNGRLDNHVTRVMNGTVKERMDEK